MWEMYIPPPELIPLFQWVLRELWEQEGTKKSMAFSLIRNWLSFHDPAWATWTQHTRFKADLCCFQVVSFRQDTSFFVLHFPHWKHHICLTELLWGSNEMMCAEGYYKLVSYYKYSNSKSLWLKKGGQFWICKRTRNHLLRHLKVKVRWSGGFLIWKHVLECLSTKLKLENILFSFQNVVEQKQVRIMV